MTDTLPARTGLGPGGLRTRPIDAEQLADIAKFEQMLVRYPSGDMTEDVFRVFRLNNGIYGQRQGGTNQMVRVKVPYGSIDARAARDDGLHRRHATAVAGATSPPARTSSSTSSQLDDDPRRDGAPRVGRA